MVWNQSKQQVQNSSSRNKVKIINDDSVTCCKFKVTRNRYCGSPRSEFKKADLCVSLIYSTGSSACPAGPGRSGPLGHSSLLDTSFTETLTVYDRGGEMERWKCDQYMVLLALEKRKEKRWELELKEILYSCSTFLSEAGIRDLPYGLRERTVKVERRVQSESEYKVEVMAEDVVTSWIRDGLWKPPCLSQRKKGRRRGEPEVRVGECVLTKPFERSCYELVVNLCIL